MKNVVIIGGGFAGSTIARELESKFNVTLIDNKPYFEFTPGILRSIAHPTKSRCMQQRHEDYLKSTKILVGSVSRIGKNYVLVENKKIHFDYLVIATGSSYKAPFKHPQLFAASRSDELARYNRYIVDGKHVLIIGSGLVGVELAGEIAHYYCGKKVTLVSSNKYLLDRMPQKARDYAHKKLVEMGVEVIFDERVVKNKNKIFTTLKNLRVNGDIGFMCTGIVPNTSFLDKKMLDDKGFLKVDYNLRLVGYDNIFAAGDITNINEEKTGQNAEKQAKVVLQNILRLSQSRKLVDYKSVKSPIVISLGPRNGIFIWGNFVFTGMIPALLKWAVEKKELMKRR